MFFFIFSVDNQWCTEAANSGGLSRFFERDNLNDELQLVKHEKQTTADQVYEYATKLPTLTQSNNEFKERIIVYEKRLRDGEDETERYRSELIILQRDNQNIKEQYEIFQHKLEESERKYKIALNDKKRSEKEKDEILQEIQTLRKENSELQYELDRLEIRIRLEITQKYENDYRKRYSEISETKDLEIETYEHEIKRRNADFNTAKKTNEEIEHDVSLKYTSQFNVQNDRIEIRIHELEQDLETKEEFIQTYKKSLKTKDQHIEKLLDDIKQVDNSNSDAIETLQEELSNRERQIEKLINEKSLATQEHERYISELQLNIQDCQRKLTQTNDQLQQSEQKFYALQFEIDDFARNRKSLETKLKFALEDKENHLDTIRNLQQQLEMEKKINSLTPSEQRDQYQSIIDDLKDKFKQREKSVQNLQNSLHQSNEELNDVRQAHNKLQSDHNRTTLRHDRMETQLTSDVENRDQLIATLRQKLSDKEREINNLHEINIDNGKKINELHSKLIAMGPNFDSTFSSERVSPNIALQIDIQKKDQEIIDLRNKLEALQNMPSTASSSRTIIRPEQKARVHINYDNLNREELLYELEMALQHSEELNEQLKNKFPTITELHKQLVEIRHELSRQKYVNQVLWRKLNALIDIHGSNTRAELTIELANYQDELAKLKSQQSRTNDIRSAKLDANSRSSSEQNLCSLHNGMSSTSIELPTKNIKSTIALLERSNIEWQTKLARLTEQLGRSENQSRNYHRELTKYQKILYEAGLIEPSTRQRRRSADDSVIIDRNQSNKIHDDLTEIENIHELREIIRNQRKFIQQLQMRVRTNTPDIIQLPTIDKLKQQIQNLNLVIETYQDESNLLKTELKKLYKTIEHSRKTQQNYEKIFREQQICIAQSKKKLNKYEQFFKKYDNHLPIFDERKEHIINPMDEYIIDLDIDILQGNDTKKKTSVAQRDSALSSTTNTNELQRQINEKDEQIRKLNNDINTKGEQIQDLMFKLTKT
ncbi:unnamed protein product [Rotaria sp. Silwood2]|nr:unnamed protein product [Rotaria sp. Silwood2]